LPAPDAPASNSAESRLEFVVQRVHHNPHVVLARRARYERRELFAHGLENRGRTTQLQAEAGNFDAKAHAGLAYVSLARRAGS
jgi:hypothetical protein